MAEATPLGGYHHYLAHVTQVRLPKHPTCRRRSRWKKGKVQEIEMAYSGCKSDADWPLHDRHGGFSLGKKKKKWTKSFKIIAANIQKSDS